MVAIWYFTGGKVGRLVMLLMYKLELDAHDQYDQDALTIRSNGCIVKYTIAYM